MLVHTDNGHGITWAQQGMRRSTAGSRGFERDPSPCPPGISGAIEAASIRAGIQCPKVFGVHRERPDVETRQSLISGRPCIPAIIALPDSAGSSDIEH